MSQLRSVQRLIQTLKIKHGEKMTVKRQISIVILSLLSLLAISVQAQVQNKRNSYPNSNAGIYVRVPVEFRIDLFRDFKGPVVGGALGIEVENKHFLIGGSGGYAQGTKNKYGRVNITRFSFDGFGKVKLSDRTRALAGGGVDISNARFVQLNDSKNVARPFLGGGVEFDNKNNGTFRVIVGKVFAGSDNQYNHLNGFRVSPSYTTRLFRFGADIGKYNSEICSNGPGCGRQNVVDFSLRFSWFLFNRHIR